MKQVRNITVDYIYRFFSCFDLADSIWVLFLVYRDMSLFEIGILEGIFHLTGIAFEIPTGAIADLFGRRRTLILGRIVGVISAVLMLVGGNFFVYTLAMITACASIAVYTILFYSQDYFSTIGMSNSAISTLGFIGGIIAAVGALFSYKIHHHLKKKSIFVVCFLIAMTCIGMGVPKLSMTIPVYALMLTLNAIMECIISNQLNERIPSRQRATLLSVQSMLFSVGMIVIFRFVVSL